MAGAPIAGEELLAEPYFATRTDLDAYESLGSHRLGKSRLLAAHFRRDRPDLGQTLPNDRSDMLMAVVNLRPQGGNEIWCEGRNSRRAPMSRGGPIRPAKARRVQPLCAHSGGSTCLRRLPKADPCSARPGHP